MGLRDAVAEIRVKITGDAAGLNRALGGADAGIRGFAVKAGGVLVAAAAGKEVLDFLGDSTAEADRLGDAIFNLETQLGGLAAPLVESAGAFSEIGASKQDIIEMEARFADLATSIGIADPLIAATAESTAATAAAMALLSDKEPDVILDLIAKAAAGSAKAARELGVTLDEDLGPAEQLTAILAQLKPKLDAATSGTADLEQQQAEWQAKVETLQAELGDKLGPALATVLGFINDEIDAIPHAIEGFARLGQVIGDTAAEILSPIARARDAVEGFLDLLGGVFGATDREFDSIDSRIGETASVLASDRFDERNGIRGRMGPP